MVIHVAEKLDPKETVSFEELLGKRGRWFKCNLFCV
jgi:hypothetical protein